jgi:excisionase family DNA binding protein
MRSIVEKLALTVAEAAALGGPCRSILYQDIASGRLRAVKRGRSTRILVKDFEAYMASLPSFPINERNAYRFQVKRG